MSFEGTVSLDNMASLPLPDSSQFKIPWSADPTHFENGNLVTSISNSHHTSAQADICNLTSTERPGEKIIDFFDTMENSMNRGKMFTEIPTEYSSESSSSSPPLSQPDSQTTIGDQSALPEMSSYYSPDSKLPDSTSPGLNNGEAVSEFDCSLDFWSQVTSTGDMFLAENNKEESRIGSTSQDCKQKALRYPPCAVCTGKSSGLHYGCYTCEACKNFFRRYLLRSGGFNCKKKNNCVINNRSRGNCSGCRLKKCLEMGMSKEKSKIGRYTHSQRTETIREVNKLEGKVYLDEADLKHESSSESQQAEFIPRNLSEDDKNKLVSDQASNSEPEALTDSEKELLDVLTKAMDAIEHFGERGRTPEGLKQIMDEHYERYLAKVRLIGPLRAIPKDEYFTLLKLYNIDLDGRWDLFKQEANNCAHIVERYCKFAYQIPGFQSLSLKDQEILLKIGHCDFFLILMHEGYDHERQIFLEMNGVPSHIEEAADKIFSRVLIEMQADIYLRWQKAKLMKEEKVVLCAMGLSCSDRVNLDNPNAVEKIHSDLTALLMKIMRINYGENAQKRFSKFIDILTFCRQAADAYFKEYQEMSQFDMIQQVAPAFPTLCPDNF